MTHDSAAEENQARDPVTLVEASQLVFLDAKKLRFFKHGATLRLTVEDDRSYLKVSVLRAFPLSEPSRFLSVRDGANKEVGLIVDPAELSDENRMLVHEDLERRYLVPAVNASSPRRSASGRWIGRWKQTGACASSRRGTCGRTSSGLRRAASSSATWTAIATTSATWRPEPREPGIALPHM